MLKEKPLVLEGAAQPLQQRRYIRSVAYFSNPATARRSAVKTVGAMAAVKNILIPILMLSATIRVF